MGLSDASRERVMTTDWMTKCCLTEGVVQSFALRISTLDLFVGIAHFPREEDIENGGDFRYQFESSRRDIGATRVSS
jgi:hypothetical protein